MLTYWLQSPCWALHARREWAASGRSTAAPSELRVVLAQSRCSTALLGGGKREHERKRDKARVLVLSGVRGWGFSCSSLLQFSSLKKCRHLSKRDLLGVRTCPSRFWPIFKETFLFVSHCSLGTNIFLPLPPFPDIPQSHPTYPGVGCHAPSCPSWHPGRLQAWKEEHSWSLPNSQLLCLVGRLPLICRCHLPMPTAGWKSPGGKSL